MVFVISNWGLSCPIARGIFIIWLAVLPCVSSLVVSTSTTAIVESAPWFARIKESCGGALIHPRFVVMAAHCEVPLNRIYLNVTDIPIKRPLSSSSSVEEAEILSVHRHPGYDAFTRQNDIMLLELKEKVADAIAPIGLRTPSSSSSSIAALGFDLGQTRLTQVPLQQLDAANTLCNNISDQTYCAVATDTTSCLDEKDDSGPIFDAASHQLVGILAYSTCLQPAIITDILPFTSWIDSVIEGATPPTPAPTNSPISQAFNLGGDTTSPSAAPSEPTRFSQVFPGDPIDVSLYPWFATLDSLCGGSLVGERFLLMAAHCEDVQFVLVNATSANPQAPSVQRIEVEQFLRHPQWNEATGENDIMLVELKMPVRDIAPVKLRQDMTMESLLVVGIEQTELASISLEIESDDACGLVNSDSQFCASVPEDVCITLNGGPVIHSTDSTQIGLLSTPAGDEGSCGKPATYTKVAFFNSWILSTVGVPTPSPPADITSQPINLAGGLRGDTSEPSVSPSFAPEEEIVLDPSSYSWFSSFEDGCSGSLISERHVLMAAHCTVSGTVFLNSTTIPLRPQAQEVAIETQTRHPAWNPETLENDIMVLKLVLSIDGIEPVSYQNVFDNPEPILVFVGIKDQVLTTTGIKQQPADRCPNLVDPETQICAAPDDDECIDSSSGPVVQPTDLKQAALLSFGEPCGRPSVYTNIAAYSNWISSVVDRKEGSIRGAGAATYGYWD